MQRKFLSEVFVFVDSYHGSPMFGQWRDFYRTKDRVGKEKNGAKIGLRRPSQNIFRYNGLMSRNHCHTTFQVVNCLPFSYFQFKVALKGYS